MSEKAPIQTLTKYNKISTGRDRQDEHAHAHARTN